MALPLLFVAAGVSRRWQLKVEERTEVIPNQNNEANPLDNFIHSFT
jgi:hypothetical protein